MKNRILLLLVVAVLIALGMWSIARRGTRTSGTRPAPVATKAPPPEVPIQNGKTLDFSSGKAVVKDSPADRAALEKSVADMNAAARDVTFAPTAPTKSTSTPAPVEKK